MSQNQADACQKEERAGDRTRIDLPPALRRGPGIKIAEELEIPCEMVGCHGEKRHTPQSINQCNARKGGRGMLALREGQARPFNCNMSVIACVHDRLPGLGEELPTGQDEDYTNSREHEHIGPKEPAEIADG